ncbi:MAG TPA: hypothetical protein VGO47_10940, partial [Chlamydiales bacterium]|nr:hypothetical protein [Chlamydiales bacterium]
MALLFRYLVIRPLYLKRIPPGPSLKNSKSYKWSLFATAAAASGAVAFALPTVHLDAPKATSVDIIKDPATNIEFPKTL